jgi:hypothetical protein
VQKALRWLVVPVALVAVAALGLPSSADHATRPIVGPLQPMGDAPHVVDINGNINTDLAFWGNRAFMGLWDGFMVIDISNPAAPQTLLLYEDCDGNQGDLLVWENLLIRSWNSNAPGTTTCDGQIVPAGFEGLHVFDISNLNNPNLIASVDLPFGSHTATLVPDLGNNRLLVYNSASSASNPGIDIVQIPLSNPAAASPLRFEQSGRSCHDTAVFLGDVLRAVCAGGNGFTVFSMDPADGGSLTNPVELYTQTVQGVTVGHAASFTWDGEMFAFGHEPGGGVDDRCDTADREFERTQYFFETDTGELLGSWTMNPPQTEVVENCTIHNFNFIPTMNGRDIVVGAHYQAGTWVVDVTDPANPFVIARADPPPLDPNVLIDGGAWSGYWYNGFIYESEITKGLHIFKLNIPDASPGGFRPEAFSNPQTQLERIDLPNCKGQEGTLAGLRTADRLNGTSLDDVIVGLGGNDRINGLQGNDLICGGAGRDKLRGSLGDDVLQGQGGRDTLNGGPGLPDRRGDDTCNGGGGRDRAARSCETKRKI